MPAADQHDAEFAVFDPRYLASAMGTVQDVPDRKLLFDKISTQIPSGWLPDSAAVNYQGNRNTSLVRLQGRPAPERATATLHTITARLNDQASIENPEAVAPVSRSFTYAKDLTIELEPYTVAVLDIHTI